MTAGWCSAPDDISAMQSLHIKFMRKWTREEGKTVSQRAKTPAAKQGLLSRHDKGVAPITSQQYECLNRTCKMTTPVDMPMKRNLTRPHPKMKSNKQSVTAERESIFFSGELPDRLFNPKWSSLHTCT